MVRDRLNVALSCDGTAIPRDQDDNNANMLDSKDKDTSPDETKNESIINAASTAISSHADISMKSSVSKDDAVMDSVVSSARDSMNPDAKMIDTGDA